MTSTFDDVDDVAQARRSRRGAWARRAFALGLTIFLALAVLNLFGVRRASVRDTGPGLRLTVDYASVSRPGLATPWSVTVEGRDGQPLPASLDLQTTAAYFDEFDENGLDPEPESSTQDAEWVTWTYEPEPDQAEVVVSFDARLEPGLRLGRRATTRVLVDGEVVASVRYRTWITP